VDFTIRHPQDRERRATYGHDGRGYFAEVTLGGVRIVYANFSSRYDHAEPLYGALVFLSSLGFFNGADLEDALALARGDQVIEVAVGRVRRVLRVIERFRAAAGE